MFVGTRGSPNAPTKIASNSRASIWKPSGGMVVPSIRYRSAPQSKLVNATAAPLARMTSMALGMTSLPMPSPGMTAMHLFGTGTKIAEAPPDAASTASADMDASAWVAITTAHLINLYDSYQGTTLVVPNRAQKRSGL